MYIIDIFYILNSKIYYCKQLKQNNMNNNQNTLTNNYEIQFYQYKFKLCCSNCHITPQEYQMRTLQHNNKQNLVTELNILIDNHKTRYQYSISNNYNVYNDNALYNCNHASINDIIISTFNDINDMIIIINNMINDILNDKFMLTYNVYRDMNGDTINNIVTSTPNNILNNTSDIVATGVNNYNNVQNDSNVNTHYTHYVNQLLYSYNNINNTLFNNVTHNQYVLVRTSLDNILKSHSKNYSMHFSLGKNRNCDNIKWKTMRDIVWRHHINNVGGVSIGYSGINNLQNSVNGNMNNYNTQNIGYNNVVNNQNNMYNTYNQNNMYNQNNTNNTYNQNNTENTIHLNNITHTQCFCCKQLVAIKGTMSNPGYNCAHVLAYGRGGKDIESNLRVTCNKCNQDMNTSNLYLWMLYKGQSVPEAHKALITYQLYERLSHLVPDIVTRMRGEYNFKYNRNVYKNMLGNLLSCKSVGAGYKEYLMNMIVYNVVKYNIRISEIFDTIDTVAMKIDNVIYSNLSL